MHVVLLILKIIGIILLILLAILIALILILLFVPIFYSAEGRYIENTPYAKACIRFLFPLLHVFIKYENENPEGKVKLLGFTVYDFFANRDSEHGNKKVKKSSRNATDKTTKKTIKNVAKTDSPSADVEDTRKIQLRKVETTHEVNGTDGQGEEQNSLSDEVKTQTLIEKIRYFIFVIKEKWKAFLLAIKRLKEKGIQKKKKAEEIVQKITFYKKVWEMEVTQSVFRKAKRSLYRLWRGVRPRKGKIRVCFGTDDPATTGEICAFIGMIYPFVGKYVMIEPDFEHKILEGDFYFKGYITCLMLLRVAWVVLFDKDIKNLRKILMNSNKEEKNE